MAKSSFVKPGAKPATTPAPAPASARKSLAPAAKPTPAKRLAPPAAETPPARPSRAPAKPAKPAAAPTDEGTETSTELAIVADERGELAPAVANNLMGLGLGQSSGQMTTGDFAFPKLKLAQGVGPLRDAGFEPGDIVLNDAVVIGGDGYGDIELTILKYVKQFVENLPYGSDEMPRIFATMEEAQAEGLNTEWGPNGEKPDALPQLVCMVLVKQPEGIDPADFPIEHESGLYAIAEWRISGTAYALTRIITGAQRTRLKNGLHTGSFLLNVRKVTGKFTYHVPTLAPGQMHDDEFIQFLKANAG